MEKLPIVDKVRAVARRISDLLHGYPDEDAHTIPFEKPYPYTHPYDHKPTVDARTHDIDDRYRQRIARLEDGGEALEPRPPHFDEIDLWNE